MSDSVSPLPSFLDLALIDPVLKALDDIGYETPSPIQAKIIPFMLQGKDVLGQAQTGTGKTAAFALPILSRIDLKLKDPQVLVLAPTRELAIQVAEAFQGYAARLKGFHVLPIYGGQDYNVQLRQLTRGVHVVVGTPGRVMDHMRRGTLKLDSLKTLVLDEADEMLRMGFIDDVEWILEQTPKQRQIALFSATMPSIIRKIAQKYLNNPEEVTIKVKATETPAIRQRFWFVSGLHKLDALTWARNSGGHSRNTQPLILSPGDSVRSLAWISKLLVLKSSRVAVVRLLLLIQKNSVGFSACRLCSRTHWPAIGASTTYENTFAAVGRLFVASMTAARPTGAKLTAGRVLRGNDIRVDPGRRRPSRCAHAGKTALVAPQAVGSPAVLAHAE
jgi:superfamily II DNA/RNA helicase